MWPSQDTFHIQVLVYVLFLQTPPIELKLGQQRGAGTTNSKPPGPINHYDGSIRNTEQQSDHIYYTRFCKCTARATCTIVWSQIKPFSWVKPTYVGFSSSNLTLHDHILYFNSLVWLWQSSGSSQKANWARPSIPGFSPTGPAMGGVGSGPSQKVGRLSVPLHGWNGHGRSLVPAWAVRARPFSGSQHGGAWPGGGALRYCRREKRRRRTEEKGEERGLEEWCAAAGEIRGGGGGQRREKKKRREILIGGGGVEARDYTVSEGHGHPLVGARVVQPL